MSDTELERNYWHAAAGGRGRVDAIADHVARSDDAYRLGFAYGLLEMLLDEDGLNDSRREQIRGFLRGAGR